MSRYSIKDCITSTDRYKLFTLMCHQDEIVKCITFLKAENIITVNLGKELAAFIDGLEDFCYLNIEVFEFVKNLLNKYKAKISETGNEVIAVYNLGILLEPALELNAAHLLKEYSKTTAIIIIWENQSVMPARLHWPAQQSKFFLEFSEAQIKIMQYAI